MSFNSTEFLIFGLSVFFLIFSVLLWLGRPKIDSSKEKPSKKSDKTQKSKKRGRNESI